ncbi:MAG: hypothetical protein JJU29_19470 [Verrucomicrobia bacterium]|nr:hypothetical protein [Verrucomicrobiota bacterium]MCH8514095.1 hypothetical protein [Kiritimatiellia bacterium]
MKHKSKWMILLSLLVIAGCRREQVVVVDTSPIGSGLAVIGIGLVLAAWITSLFGGQE